MLSLLASPCGLSVSGRALLNRATELPVYVTKDADRAELLSLAAAAETEARDSGASPEWPRDSELLCQEWRLIATTRTAGSDALQQMAKQPALGTFRVAQNWKERDGTLRCDNVVSIGRPNDGLLSAWTLLPAGGQSSLKLLHKARVVSEGQPLRITIELDAVVLDGNRKAGEPVEPILQLPLPPRLAPGLPPPPALPVPGLAAAVEEAGTFEVTLLDEQLRVVRGRTPGGAGGGEVLRVFARDTTGGELPTW
eukprot:Transcript_18750.p1 GENE.Transcript_18750~~Transcript_18750.p1  ORF type:complete len:267 (-),score=74.54 Transcript_18750:302-1060(-)